MTLSIPAPGITAPLLIDAPSGQIEALWSAPRQCAQPPAVAVVCHPHPLRGGAMTNKVTWALANAAQKAGMHALRFNFRGVGKSSGEHAQGIGETDDVVWLAQWMQAQVPGARVALMGFSFGGWVSIQAAAHVQPFVQVSVAPPFYKYVPATAPLPQRPPCPWMVIHGDADEIVDFAQTRAAVDHYQPAVVWVTVEGAGHFFHGRLTELDRHIAPFLRAQLSV